MALRTSQRWFASTAIDTLSPITFRANPAAAYIVLYVYSYFEFDVLKPSATAASESRASFSSL